MRGRTCLRQPSRVTEHGDMLRLGAMLPSAEACPASSLPTAAGRVVVEDCEQADAAPYLWGLPAGTRPGSGMAARREAALAASLGLAWPVPRHPGLAILLPPPRMAKKAARKVAYPLSPPLDVELTTPPKEVEDILWQKLRDR